MCVIDGCPCHGYKHGITCEVPASMDDCNEQGAMWGSSRAHTQGLGV